MSDYAIGMYQQRIRKANVSAAVQLLSSVARLNKCVGLFTVSGSRKGVNMELEVTA